MRGELLGELRGQCDRLPVPDRGWHPYVALIGACRDDFEQALGLARDHEQVLEALAALMEDGSRPALDPGAPAGLAAAWERLRALPVPAGQHPYLDEILSALEALELLLVAIGQVPAAAARMVGPPTALAA